MTRTRIGLLLVLGSAIAMAVACGASDFDSQSKVKSVRIFGVRPDKPYALSGETVTLEVLSADGRTEKPRPMKIFWIPFICVNPREDLYYACFIPGTAPDGTPIDGGTRLVPAFSVDAGAGAGDAGAGGLLAQLPPNIDLSNFLPQGPTFTFRMPDDMIKTRPGSPPYGLAIIFNIACAGQVRFVQRTGNNPQQIPLQCTDEEGNQLTPDDYVIGINRVYSYPDRRNANPIVEHVTLDGGVVDPNAGMTLKPCVASRRSECPPVKFGVRVSDTSWEENPQQPGTPASQREQIWVTYYSDLGDLANEARLLFDAKQGRIEDSDVEFRTPYAPAEGTLWAVVHDNRAGAAFVVVPIHVKP